MADLPPASSIRTEVTRRWTISADGLRQIIREHYAISSIGALTITFDVSEAELERAVLVYTTVEHATQEQS